MSEVRVVLADDHPLVRSGLAALLESAHDISVVGAAADGQEAVRVVSEQLPDVVLMDLSMPALDGVEATRRVVNLCPDTKVVVLTTFSDREHVLDALDAGAIGYLLKDAEPDYVVDAVRAAARGESPISPKAASVVLGARAPVGLRELSPREREVLCSVAYGLANKQIARRLGISEKTVKAHLTNIFHTIGVSDRTQAALWALRQGLT